jgi:predicted Zn finger-like uncharacterized protein
MYSQCPHCSTVFEIDPPLLAPARGRLCCGVCGQEFDALARLAITPDGLASDGVAGGSPPVEAPRVEPPTDPAQVDLFAPPPAAPTVRPGAAPAAQAAEHVVPSFARRSPAPASRDPGSNNARWFALALLLTAMLALQIVFAQRAELASDARWRAWLAPVCDRLGCELPPWRDAARLTLASRAIGPHPSVPGALMVTATVQNDAAWPQSWPLLELTLSDLDGRPVAMRRFTAREYLGGPPSAPTLAPGQSAVVQLELADPGKDAVAFAFDFH